MESPRALNSRCESCSLLVLRFFISAFLGFGFTAEQVPSRDRFLGYFPAQVFSVLITEQQDYDTDEPVRWNL